MLPPKTTKKIIYLDHAAATFLDPKVKQAMEPFLASEYGNPSALYSKGLIASKAIASSRKIIATIIGARPNEIIFTAGGTEANNLAILGLAKKHKMPQHFIATTIEHSSVLKSLDALVGEGHKISLINVDKEGFVDFDKLKKEIRPQTVLISVMYANNEIGSIQPIAEIGKWLTRINNERTRKNLNRIYFHTDACQAAGVLDVNVNHLGVDFMTVNGSKIYGPKQVGFLYVRSGVELEPLIYGGGQERGLRSGTENVAGIVGMATALELAQQNKEKENIRLLKLRDRMFKNLKASIKALRLNGPGLNNKILNRLPNNLNLSFSGIEGESLLLYLDSYGICVSTGSACDTNSLEPSHVLSAIGLKNKDIKSSIRITLGKNNSIEEINYVAKILSQLVKELSKVKTPN